MADITLEVCVETVAGLQAARRGGADRIELCTALALGGLTPSVGLMTAAAESGLPVNVLIRPRPGNFHYGAEDLTAMRDDIAAVGEAGLSGVVIGALDADGGLDLPALRAMMADAAGLSVTLHRCFDLASDQGLALRQAIDLGIGTVLTSGGAVQAVDAVEGIARLIDLAAGQITVMPGSGITAQTVRALRGLKLAAVHASCSEPVDEPPAVAAFGFGPPVRRDTSEGAVRALVQELRSWG